MENHRKSGLLLRQRRARNKKVHSARYGDNLDKKSKIILYEYRSNDRKHQRDNDLDLQDVKMMLVSQCVFCGESKLRMTFDRIDNKKGHLKK